MESTKSFRASKALPSLLRLILLGFCRTHLYDASALYVETENNSLKHIETEWEASITTIKIAKDIAILTLRNGFGRDYI